MAGISVAESTKHSKAPKVLHHLEVHPKMGGGVNVEHHHSSMEHKMEAHPFEEHEGAAFHAHMTKHTGMHHEELDEQSGSEPDEYDKE